MIETLSGVLADLDRQGYVQHFWVVGNELQTVGSPKTFATNEVVIREYHRFEGVSDPDDMSIVFALESVTGTRGTLVDAFGVYASPVVSAVMANVAFGDRRRPDTRQPPEP